MLEDCDWMMVVPLHGWRESRGVVEELGFALERMPVYIWQNARPDFEPLDDEELESAFPKDEQPKIASLIHAEFPRK
jgi:hypothetical protein